MKELFNNITFDKNNRRIVANGKTYQFIPEGGKLGETIIWDGLKVRWGLPENEELEQYTYGVSWSPNQADPHLKRVGNDEFHYTLPIQSGMRGCIFNALEGKVVYWLDPDNWNYKEDGTPSRLDGYDGEVMVYIPEFWIKSWETPTENCVRITPFYIDDSWEHLPECYISAYKISLLRTVPDNMGYLSKLPSNSAVSIVNSLPYCRGGSNNSSLDKYIETDPCRSTLNKPTTSLNLPNFRKYARNGNKEVLSYIQYKNILYWLYVIEYANFNNREEFIDELDNNGYRLGGLGLGVSGIDRTHWEAYFDGLRYLPITPKGYCNELGNRTGIKNMKIITPVNTGETPTEEYNFPVIRWRGFDNPFGETYTMVDGIIVEGHGDANIDNKVYVCKDPTKYSDNLNDSYIHIGYLTNFDGLVIDWYSLGSTADIIPKVTIKDTNYRNIYKCCYNTTYTDTGDVLKCVIFGQTASSSGASIASFNSYFRYAEGNGDSYVGCFAVYVPSDK